MRRDYWELRKKLHSAIWSADEEYLGSVFEIMGFQTAELWFNVQEDEDIVGIQNMGIEGNLVVDMRQVLKIGGEFVTQSYPVCIISHIVIRQFRYIKTGCGLFWESNHIFSWGGNPSNLANSYTNYKPEK